MSVLQPMGKPFVQTLWYEDFITYTTYPNGTLVDDMTSDYTRHYPATSRDRLYFNATSNRLQMNTTGGGYAPTNMFSWDLPGSMSGSFRWRIHTHDPDGTFRTQLIFCWTPHASQTDVGSCYIVDVQDKNQRLQYWVNGSLDTTLDTDTYDIQTTAKLYTEVDFGGSGNDIDVFYWRDDGSKPTTPQLTASSPTLTTGKIGFWCYGGNAEGFLDLRCDTAWTP